MTANQNKDLEKNDFRPKITVIGVGGAGNNAVNNMVRANLQGVQYLVCNTDAQHLTQSLVEPERRLQLGLAATQGLGAGSKPEVGRVAAEESSEDITQHIKGTHMVFITAGMGGGTGTGAAPVIAKIARDMGILTVGVVTKPFHFEGPHRMRMAVEGIKEMAKYVDTLIIIPNQNLFRVANEKTTFSEAFQMADNVLYSGVRGVTDLMIMPGLINLDFADIRAIMTEMGKAMMGTGEATGEGRAIAAAEAAIANPLLDDVSMKGAKGVLINITGGLDMTLYEVDEAANRIREEVDCDTTNIIFGSTFDEKLKGVMRVSVVATGIDADEVKRQRTAAEQDSRTGYGAEPAEKATPFDAAQVSFIDPTAVALDESMLQTEGEPVLRVGSATQEEIDFLMPDDKSTQVYETFEEEEHLYAPGGEKKGFFGRFFDTLSGRREQEVDAQQQYRRFAEKIPSIKESLALEDDLEEQDLNEVPAYLRRKKKARS